MKIVTNLAPESANKDQNRDALRKTLVLSQLSLIYSEPTLSIPKLLDHITRIWLSKDINKPHRTVPLTSFDLPLLEKINMGELLKKPRNYEEYDSFLNFACCLVQGLEEVGEVPTSILGLSLGQYIQVRH